MEGAPARVEDAWDREDFDAVKFCKELFPDEASLKDVDKVIEVVKRRTRAVDEEIFAAVRVQGGAGPSSRSQQRQELGAISSGQVSELFARLRDIQRQAEESEAQVADICRDIRKLDAAKRHLGEAIAALKGMANLQSALGELEAVTAHRREQYRQAAHLLEAVAQLAAGFSAYEAVPRLAAVLGRIQAVQGQLGTRVLDEFRSSMASADAQLGPEQLERLASACLVIDVLGPRVREQLLSWLADREAAAYTSIFGTGRQALTALERFDRRYAWFRSRLEEKKEVWALFPPQWRVAQLLAANVCRLSRAALVPLLADHEGSLRQDISLLIRLVVATKQFEAALAHIFGGALAREGGGDEFGGVASSFGSSGGQQDDAAPGGARRRLERYHASRSARTSNGFSSQDGGLAELYGPSSSGIGGGAAAHGAAAEEAAEAARSLFLGSISDAFEGSLRLYVAEEERELSALCEALVREEGERRWLPGGPEDADAGPGSPTAAGRVLHSANALFIKIRGSLQRCVRLISNGPPLLLLADAFRRVLTQYAGELSKRLPKTAKGATSVVPPLGPGGDWHIRLGEAEERVVCAILATAEFCRDTAAGLAAAIGKEVQPGLANRVELGDVEGAFSNVSAACMSVLVVGTVTRLDQGAMAEMLAQRWDAMEAIGDDSPFVNSVRKVLLDVVPRVGRALPAMHFTFFAEKLARLFVPHFTDCIHRIKRLGEKGSVQLAIDTEGLRRVLLDVAKLAPSSAKSGAGLHDGDDGGDAAVAAPDLSGFVAYVDAEMGAAVHLVKVLQASAHTLVDTYLLLMPAHHQTGPAFLRLCELKGVPKKQQAELLQQYQRQLGGRGAAAVAAGEGAAPLGGNAAAAALAARPSPAAAAISAAMAAVSGARAPAAAMMTLAPPAPGSSTTMPAAAAPAAASSAAGSTHGGPAASGLGLLGNGAAAAAAPAAAQQAGPELQRTPAASGFKAGMSNLLSFGKSSRQMFDQMGAGTAATGEPASGATMLAAATQAQPSGPDGKGWQQGRPLGGAGSKLKDRTKEGLAKMGAFFQGAARTKQAAAEASKQ